MDLVAACRLLVAVGERGSVTEAAAAAGVAQSVASRRVAALEQRLDVVLLDRSARRARLTGAGRHLLPAARRVVVAAEELEAAAARAGRGP
ncbi:LysR family transcriptional regulator, partial [Nocardioides sp. ChNu-99]